MVDAISTLPEKCPHSKREACSETTVRTCTTMLDQRSVRMIHHVSEIFLRIVHDVRRSCRIDRFQTSQRVIIIGILSEKVLIVERFVKKFISVHLFEPMNRTESFDNSPLNTAKITGVNVEKGRTTESKRKKKRERETSSSLSILYRQANEHKRMRSIFLFSPSSSSLSFYSTSDQRGFTHICVRVGQSGDVVVVLDVSAVGNCFFLRSRRQRRRLYRRPMIRCWRYAICEQEKNRGKRTAIQKRKKFNFLSNVKRTNHGSHHSKLFSLNFR